MGWSGKNEGSTSSADFYCTFTHINGTVIKIQPWNEANGNAIIDTADGKEALEAAVTALLADSDLTLTFAGLSYSPDTESYTP